MIADFGHALAHVLYGHARQQNAGAFNLNAVIKERHANRRTTLRIIGMHQRVDHRLAQQQQRNAPHILAPHGRKIGTAHGVLFQEQHDAVHRNGQVLVDVNVVKNFRLVGADKAAALHPGI